jgi:glycosyltransferase involved in cell wall biosynthesis
MLEGLVRASVELGLDVKVISTDAHGATRLDVPRGWHERDGAQVVYSRRWLRPDITPDTLPRVILAARDVDVVHVTGVFCVPTILGILGAKLAGRPVVLSPHGALERGSLAHGSTGLKRLWLKAFAPLWRSVDLFHATAEKEVHSIRRVFGEHAPVVTVPNATVPPDSLGDVVRASVPRIAAMGRIERYKRYDALLRAAAVLRDRGRDFEVSVAGPRSDPAYAEELERLIVELELTDRAKLVGEIRGAQKQAFLAESRVFAFPSDDTENFGLVVIEALSHEVAVVASSSSPWQSLESEGCGRWVENTPESLADALQPYLEDEALAVEAGRKGRELVLREYTWDSVAQGMIDAYASVVQRADARSQAPI